MLAVGTRLQDFTTGSWALFRDAGRQIIGAQRAAVRCAASTARCRWSADAAGGLRGARRRLGDWRRPTPGRRRPRAARRRWLERSRRRSPPPTNAALPSDAQVIGAVQRAARASDILVCAAGGLPGELHKLWQAEQPGGYHLEYGYSCMGYEIAGGLGVKLAQPDREVIVMVGDGSLPDAEFRDRHLGRCSARSSPSCCSTIGGFGCINRLQHWRPAAPTSTICRAAGAA